MVGSTTFRRSGGGRGVLKALASLAILVLGLVMLMPQQASAQGNPNVRPPAGASTGDGRPVTIPQDGGSYDIEMWKRLRQGVEGHVSIPDKKAGRLVDSSGETWRSLRNGPLATYGGYALGAVLALLSLFYLLRGRIRIERGRAGWTIERFNDIERMGHWLLATSFIILALTGLNILYGRYVVMPIIGKEAFASLTLAGKWLHNYVAFAFMVALVMTFVLWISHNFPRKADLIWLAKGGGLFSKHSHPPAWKFNAGQKILFWLVILGGVSISLSGLSLMFPFELPMFAKTFAALNGLGFNLPTDLSPNEELQLAATWHSMMSLFLICVVLAHIYIGTVGMEGAFDAMGSGQVDANWAREHHSLWVEEQLGHGGAGAGGKGAKGGSGHAVPAE